MLGKSLTGLSLHHPSPSSLSMFPGIQGRAARAFTVVLHFPVDILAASFLGFKLFGLWVSQQKCYYRVGWLSKYWISFFSNPKACFSDVTQCPQITPKPTGALWSLGTWETRLPALPHTPPVDSLECLCFLWSCGIDWMCTANLKIWVFSFLRGLELPVLGRGHCSVVSVS